VDNEKYRSVHERVERTNGWNLVDYGIMKLRWSTRSRCGKNLSENSQSNFCDAGSPLLGVIAGFLVGGITLNIIVKGRHAAPGDGMLIMIFGLAGLLASIPLSAVVAAQLWSQLSAKEEHVRTE
jgi:hypothetical protein